MLYHTFIVYNYFCNSFQCDALGPSENIDGKGTAKICICDGSSDEDAFSWSGLEVMALQKMLAFLQMIASVELERVTLLNKLVEIADEGTVDVIVGIVSADIE